MGKDSGKVILGIVGFAFGAGLLGGGVQFGTQSWLIGGIYGASLGSTIWSAMNPPKFENYDASRDSRFDALSNQTSSESMIPIIYGRRKWAGNNLWHSVSSDGKTITKDVLIGEGEVDSVSEIKANDILISGLPGCSHTFYSGSLSQSPPSNWETVGGYRGMAYLRCVLQISDQLQGGNPTVTYVVKGKKVTDTRTNTFVWSDNPSMCTRDFLLNKTYGLGKFIPNIEELLNEESFKEVADINDTLVNYKDSDGTTKQEKRHTLNIILDEKKNALQHLSDILANFGGFLVFSNNQISLRIEQSTTPSYHFTNANIIEKSIKYTQISIDDTPNQYKIGYFDESNNWTQIKVLEEDIIDQQDRQKIISKELTLSGCTSQRQTKTMGKLYKNLNKLCSLVVNFSTTTFAMHLEPGDVFTWTRTKFIDNQEVVVFSDKPWRILEIQEQDGIWNIKAREYNASIYNDDLNSEIEVKQYVPINSSILPPPNIQNFAAFQNMRLIEFQWQEVGTPETTYEIREGSSWDSGILIQNKLSGFKYTSTSISIGTHSYWIKAVNKYGTYSETAKLALLSVPNIPQSNIIKEINLTTNLNSGTLNNLLILGNRLYLKSSENWEDFAARYVTWKNEGVWGEPTVTTAEYESQVLTLNKSVNSIMQINYNIISDNIVIYWKYADTEEELIAADYINFVSGSYKFKYYQFKIAFNNPGTKIAYLDSFIITADVPDLIQKFINLEITDADNGIVIVFSPEYAEIPAISGNVTDGQVAKVVFSDVTSEQAKAKAYTDAGVSILTKISGQSIGY